MLHPAQPKPLSCCLQRTQPEPVEGARGSGFQLLESEREEPVEVRSGPDVQDPHTADSNAWATCLARTWLCRARPNENDNVHGLREEEPQKSATNN
jgi:hypothetical protein